MNFETKKTKSPWMPEVPKSWALMPARYCIESRQNGNWGETPLVIDDGEFCLRAADFNYETLGLKSQENFTRRLYSTNDFEKVMVRPGDLLIEKSGGGEKTPVGRAVLIKSPIRAAFSNFLERVTIRKDCCVPGFFAYWWTAGYQSSSFVPFFNQTTGIQNLNTSKLLSHNAIALPGLKEQQQIVALLDAATAKIDRAIELLQQELEVLEKLKKSIIHEAVTKGLDSTVPMKPSGVEWIGEIPEHWGVNRLRNLVAFESGATPSKDNLDFWNGDIPWVSSQEVKSNVIEATTYQISQAAVASCSTKVLSEGTPILVVRSGVLQHTVPIAVLGRPMAINQDVKALVTKGEILPKFLMYFVKGNNENLLKVLVKDKSTVDNVSSEYLKNLMVTLPPTLEQLKVVQRLDMRCETFDIAIEKKRTQLSLLEQQKTSIVFEYVTGKRRVSEGV